MAEDKDDKEKDKSLLSQLVVPVATALIVGGTAPWWVTLFQKDKPPIDNAREIPSGESIVQTNAGSGLNISAGRDVNVSAPAATKSYPSFEGEIGHFERSQLFTDFIFENQGKVVLIDAYYTPDDSSELTITNNSFGVDYIHLWHECYEQLLPGEAHHPLNVQGLAFQLTVVKHKRMQTSPLFAAPFVLRAILPFEVVMVHIKAVWAAHCVLLIQKTIRNTYA